MNQSITISQKTIEKIISRLKELTEEVKAIKAKLYDVVPPYGSDEWWEWSDKKALKSIKEGKGTAIRNKRELDEFFKKLRTP